MYLGKLKILPLLIPRPPLQPFARLCHPALPAFALGGSCCEYLDVVWEGKWPPRPVLAAAADTLQTRCLLESRLGLLHEPQASLSRFSDPVPFPRVQMPSLGLLWPLAARLGAGSKVACHPGPVTLGLVADLPAGLQSCTRGLAPFLPCGSMLFLWLQGTAWHWIRPHQELEFSLLKMRVLRWVV